VHRSIRTLLALFLASLACNASVANAQAAGPSATPIARVIVQFKAGAPRDKAGVPARDRGAVVAKRLGLAVTSGAALSADAQVLTVHGISARALVQQLRADPDVDYVVEDQRRKRHAVPDDPLYGSGVAGNGPAAGQWYLRAPQGEARASIDAERAWSVTTGSASIVVAVLDTGMRFDHPDLLPVSAGGNVLAGYDMISDGAVANDGDGRDADASDAGDFLTEAELGQAGGPFFECEDAPSDSSWHGTQVAGVIGAVTDNAYGMASVARAVRILPVRVLGKCGGFDSDIIAGMRWAAGLDVPGVPANANPARIINLSLGAEGGCSIAYRQVVADLNARGVVIVASAGNSVGHAAGAPANCNGVIAVAGLRHVGTKVGFSDLGPEIAISAPGGNCVNIEPGTPCLYPILTTSNSGATTPDAPTFTDSFDPTLGTSFAAPLVTGTVALMLSAQPAMTPVQVRVVLQATARPFPTSGGDNGDGTPVPACAAPQFDAVGQPVDQAQCYCTIDTCGAGMLDAGAAVAAAPAGLAAAVVPAQGLWWNAPSNSESGWGINFAQQDNMLFATWFTYDLAGDAWWLSMTATRISTAPDVYTGTLIETRGPPFTAVPFDASRVTRTPVGSATVTLPDVNRGTFSYTVNGVAQTKSITRLAFGPVPQCRALAHPDFASAANFQDLWWAASGAESGWGVNLTHQGDAIFATWFTYDVDGSPLWLSATAVRTDAGVYSGQLIRTTGPAFHTVPFNPALVSRVPAGTATFTFASGAAGTFAYTLGGVTQSKSISRLLLLPPAGTICTTAG